ncbi:MAG: hypothetical protein KAH15_02560, partial [Candidatus Marinimicrobia bacterium]|nr:hypothetical protein [Candidatus Neomarinimicrobiota bacterium]
MSGKFSYSLAIEKGKGIPYLSWIPFLDQKVKEKKFYWKPSSFNWNMSIAEREEDRITRSALDTSNTYSFGMSKSMKLGFNPFSSLKVTYQRSSASDLKKYRGETWKIFTDISYDSLMNGINVGDVSSMRENFSASYSPTIFSWLKPRFSYVSNYSFSTKSDQNYANAGVSRKITASGSLSLKQIWDSSKKKIDKRIKDQAKKKVSQNRSQVQKPKEEIISKKDAESRVVSKKPERKNVSGTKEPQEPNKESKNSKKKVSNRKKITVSSLLGKVDPIRVNYTDNFSKKNNGITGNDTSKIYKNVTYKYRYGLGDYYYLPTGTFEGSIGNPFSNTLSRSLSVSSGIKLAKSIKLRLDYKQNSSTGRKYRYKTSSGDYYDELIHIIAFEDTLELIPYDSSSTRNFVPLGETGKAGFTAPNYTLSWKISPSQYKWLNGKLDFIKSINLQHKMSGKESIRYRLTNDEIKYYLGEETSTYTLNFTPLIKADFSFNGNLRIGVGYNKMIKIDNQGDVEVDYLNTSVT